VPVNGTYQSHLDCFSLKNFRVGEFYGYLVGSSSVNLLDLIAVSVVPLFQLLVWALCVLTMFPFCRESTYVIVFRKYLRDA